MALKIMNKWNIYVIALGHLYTDNFSRIQGARVGLCGSNMNIVRTRITSNGMGCKAGKGLGPGKQVGMCAGSGASHGGKGGYGGSESNDPNEKAICKASFPQPYFFG